jgi:hypothetical protein
VPILVKQNQPKPKVLPKGKGKYVALEKTVNGESA